jgi:UDP-2,3-diacylglucosamine hydrolase
VSTLFISDLHLDPARPTITALFLRFLHEEARNAEALYILGDLFEADLGDDDDSAEVAATCAALRDLQAAGVACFFLRGNRDFLVGPGFAARSGATLLPDPAVILLQGEPTLLLHGDLLCTDDVAYQAFRRQVRDAQWQAQFLAQPLAARRAFAEKARAASKAHQQQVAETITDVNPDEVLAMLGHYGIRRMIHGHTHRPAIHDLGQRRQRIVLGDWYDQGSVLRVSTEGVALSTLG